jgi:hypothetical protein
VPDDEHIDPREKHEKGFKLNESLLNQTNLDIIR